MICGWGGWLAVLGAAFLLLKLLGHHSSPSTLCFQVGRSRSEVAAGQQKRADAPPIPPRGASIIIRRRFRIPSSPTTAHVLAGIKQSRIEGPNNELLSPLLPIWWRVTCRLESSRLVVAVCGTNLPAFLSHLQRSQVSSQPAGALCAARPRKVLRLGEQMPAGRGGGSGVAGKTPEHVPVQNARR